MLQDIRDYARSLLGKWLIAALLVLDFVGLGALQFPELSDASLLRPYLIAVAFALLLFAGFIVFRDERQWRFAQEARARPHLTKVRHGVGMAEARPGSGGSAGWDYFVTVVVANDPPVPDPAAEAKRVSAELLVYQAGTDNLIMERRPLPIRAGEGPEEVVEVDMPPTGRPFTIVVMRKAIRERDCYFWDSRFQTHHFAPGAYDLVLTLRGIGTRRTLTFTLRNPDSDDGPELEWTGES